MQTFSFFFLLSGAQYRILYNNNIDDDDNNNNNNNNNNLSLILRKANIAHEFSENKEKINHLLFMHDLKFYSRSEKGLDSLVQTASVFSKDIGMQFGIEKCAMLVMEIGKIVESVGIQLPDGEVFK